MRNEVFVYLEIYSGSVYLHQQSGGYLELLRLLRKISITQTTQNDLGITQNYLGNPMEGQTIELLRTTQIDLELLRTTQLKSSYLGKYQLTQETTQDYLGITQEIQSGNYLELLRNLLGTTQNYLELLRNLLIITQEITQNYLENYLELLRSTQNYLGNYLELLRRIYTIRFIDWLPTSGPKC